MSKSKFQFTIDSLGNDAFVQNRDGEVARLLRMVADKVERGDDSPSVLRDTNGNVVGRADFRGRE